MYIEKDSQGIFAKLCFHRISTVKKESIDMHFDHVLGGCFPWAAGVYLLHVEQTTSHMIKRSLL